MTDHVRIKNYQDALAYLGNKKERPIAHNTRIESAPSFDYQIFTITYHGNPIVRMYPDFTAYNSCGWKTPTTKERINWYLPEGFILYQEKSTWFVVDRRNGWENAPRWIFNDGMTIDSDGNVEGAGSESDFQETQKTLKAIKKYVSGYVKDLISGNVPAPDSGDCWYCHMVTDEGKSLGDTTGNTGHIESHFEESYYVPSMLVNAAKNGRMSDFAKGTVYQLWNGESVSDWQKDITARDVSSCLTAYLKQKLGIAQ